MARPNVGSIMDSKVLKGVKGIGTGTLVGAGLNAAFGVMEYKDAREQGYGALPAAAKAIAESVVVDVVGLPTYLGIQAAGALPKAAIKGYEGLTRQARNMSSMGRNNPFANANFNDTQQSFTMRQAGMQLAKASKHNLQSAMLGNEAQYLHL